jgi:hypothetical protein
VKRRPRLKSVEAKIEAFRDNERERNKFRQQQQQQQHQEELAARRLGRMLNLSRMRCLREGPTHAGKEAARQMRTKRQVGNGQLAMASSKLKLRKVRVNCEASRGRGRQGRTTEDKTKSAEV